MKRFLSTLLVLSLLAVLFISAAPAESSITAEPGTYYIYTENGKDLNVRDQPSFSGNVVGSLECGSEINVAAFTDANWAMIFYQYDKPGSGVGNYVAWVNRRYLTKKNPAEAADDAGEAAENSSDPLEEINNEFRGAKAVEKPYTVTVRPTRVTGWADMRWAPSVHAEILATYKANDRLLVIRELPNWLQVEDQNNGNVGFIRRSFITE